MTETRYYEHLRHEHLGPSLTIGLRLTRQAAFPGTYEGGGASNFIQIEKIMDTYPIGQIINNFQVINVILVTRG